MAAGRLSGGFDGADRRALEKALTRNIFQGDDNRATGIEDATARLADYVRAGVAPARFAGRGSAAAREVVFPNPEAIGHA